MAPVSRPRLRSRFVVSSSSSVLATKHPSLTLGAPLALAALLAACGSSDTGDAGAIDAALPDAARIANDAGVAPCDEIMVVNGESGQTATIELDTTTITTVPRDLGLACGNPSYELPRGWAPQQIIEYHVPGSGPTMVRFSTANEGTAPNFNTVIQVRSTCEDAPTAPFPPSCFDDSPSGDARAEGGVQTMGGQTIFFVVTGYSNPPAEAMQVDRGPLRLELTPQSNTAPTVEAGNVELVQSQFRLVANGTDAERNVRGISMKLYNRRSQIDLDGDGDRDEQDVLNIDLDPSAITYTGNDFAIDFVLSGSVSRLGTFCRGQCTEVALRVYDVGYAMSDEVRAPTRSVSRPSGVGGSCATTLCGENLVCNASMVCEPSMAAAAFCDAAPGITFTNTDTADTQTQSGTIRGGLGLFLISCGNTQSGEVSIGREALVAVDVPAGTFDLSATTNTSGTPEALDTLLALRRECAETASEAACNDDLSSTDRQSEISVSNLGEGRYFLLVEPFRGLADGTSAPFEVSVTLTPVLASGATCDPQRIANRCAGAACSATTMTCP